MGRVRGEEGAMGGTSGGTRDDVATIKEASRLLASVDPKSPLAAWSRANAAHINRMLHDLGLADEDAPPRPGA
jgi:hypothetical protein